MSEITITGRKRLALLSGRAHQGLALEIAELLGTELVPTTAYDFASGETFVRFEESVRGVDAFVIQSHAAGINNWVMEQLLMVDALKRASAKRITVVSPFFPYARQDKKHKGREPISAQAPRLLGLSPVPLPVRAIDLHQRGSDPGGLLFVLSAGIPGGSRRVLGLGSRASVGVDGGASAIFHRLHRRVVVVLGA